MKLVKCLVKVDGVGYVEKNVDVASLKETQGTTAHNRKRVNVEYAGKTEDGKITFKQVK